MQAAVNRHNNFYYCQSCQIILSRQLHKTFLYRIDVFDVWCKSGVAAVDGEFFISWESKWRGLVDHVFRMFTSPHLTLAFQNPHILALSPCHNDKSTTYLLIHTYFVLLFIVLSSFRTLRNVFTYFVCCFTFVIYYILIRQTTLSLYPSVDFHSAYLTIEKC